MAQITTLTDRQTGAPLYPITSSKAVFSDAGEDLDALLAGQKLDLQNSLRDYAQKTDLTKGLAKKQNSLSTSEDLQITDGNLLSLTAKAKKRLFIDLWNEACGTYGKYDPANAPDTDHPFYLNTLWLTYEEALDIYDAGVMTNDNHTLFYCGCNIKTHLPSHIKYSVITGSNSFRSSLVEFVDMGLLVPGPGCFAYCSKLKTAKIYAPAAANNSAPFAFQGCYALEEISIGFVYARSFSLADSPLINLASLQGIIGKAQAGSAAMTITVHPDIYAKLTDETNEEWHKVLTDAADKNINFATI